MFIQYQFNGKVYFRDELLNILSEKNNFSRLKVLEFEDRINNLISKFNPVPVFIGVDIDNFEEIINRENCEIVRIENLMKSI